MLEGLSSLNVTTHTFLYSLTGSEISVMATPTGPNTNNIGVEVEMSKNYYVIRNSKLTSSFPTNCDI